MGCADIVWDPMQQMRRFCDFWEKVEGNAQKAVGGGEIVLGFVSLCRVSCGESAGGGDFEVEGLPKTTSNRR